MVKKAKTENNYDLKLLTKAECIYHQNNENFDAKKIMGTIFIKTRINHNIKVIRRYIAKLKLQSEIKKLNIKKRKSSEIKDTQDIRINYINGN